MIFDLFILMIVLTEKRIYVFFKNRIVHDKNIHAIKLIDFISLNLLKLM